MLYSCPPSCDLLVVSSQDLRSLSCDFYNDRPSVEFSFVRIKNLCISTTLYNNLIFIY